MVATYEVRSGSEIIEAGFATSDEAQDWASLYLGSLGSEALDLDPFTINPTEQDWEARAEVSRLVARSQGRALGKVWTGYPLATVDTLTECEQGLRVALQHAWTK